MSRQNKYDMLLYYYRLRRETIMKNMQTHIFINKYKGDVVVKPKTNRV